MSDYDSVRLQIWHKKQFKRNMANCIVLSYKMLVFHVCVWHMMRTLYIYTTQTNAEGVRRLRQLSHDKMFDVELRVINYDHLLSSHAMMMRNEFHFHYTFFFTSFENCWSSQLHHCRMHEFSVFVSMNS